MTGWEVQSQRIGPPLVIQDKPNTQPAYKHIVLVYTMLPAHDGRKNLFLLS